MNAIYLILIGLGFTAGVISTALKSDTDIQYSKANIEKKEDSLNKIQVISEQDIEPLELLNIIY